MAHLLLIEDDDLLRDGLAAQLGQLGHSVTVAADGAIALQLVDESRCDAVMLDLGLPLVDGMAVLAHVRRRSPALPVLVLTARDSVEDRVAGLNAGADDYLTKPFSWDELQARLGALLRRAQLPAFDALRSTDGLRVHASEPRAWLVSPSGEAELELTQREWSLLSLLVARRGQVVGREEVLVRWRADDGQGGAMDCESNSVEVYIHRLRRKLEASPLLIRNVRGLGYLLQ